MSALGILIIGVGVSLICLAGLLFTILEIRSLSRQADQRQG